MAVKANLRYIRISPRKVRLVTDLLRGRSLKEAEKILGFTVKRPAKPLLKLLNSATANAEHNFGLKKEDLYISEIKVDGGPVLKRYMPRARGSVSSILKRTSHISLTLDDIQGRKIEKKGKRAKIEKVYKEEKPKQEVKKESADFKDQQQEKKKTPKVGEAKTKKVFRRKSI